MAKPYYRPKRPFVASLDQVRILRHPDGETAIIAYAEDGVQTTNLRIGPELAGLTDQEVLDVHNDVIDAQAALRSEYEHVAVEVPIGKPQIRYYERGDQWVPRGGVLRVLISDNADSDGDPAFVVDDIELTVREFAGMLHTWNGWGARITFVPDDELHEEPQIEVRDPGDTDG